MNYKAMLIALTAILWLATLTNAIWTDSYCKTTSEKIVTWGLFISASIATILAVGLGA